jgi:DNA adenine methylase
MSPDDHVRLAQCLHQTQHLFFITYDDCPEVRALYEDWAHLYPASWFYSSSNKKGREVGQELFVSNFEIPEQVTLLHEMDPREGEAN